MLSYVGVREILRRGALWNAATFNTFQAYIGVAIVYMMLTIPLSKLIGLLEKKMSTENTTSKKRRKSASERSLSGSLPLSVPEADAEGAVQTV